MANDKSMHQAAGVLQELLEMCRSLADWPRCAVEATEHVQVLKKQCGLVRSSLMPLHVATETY